MGDSQAAPALTEGRGQPKMANPTKSAKGGGASPMKGAEGGGALSILQS